LQRLEYKAGQKDVGRSVKSILSSTMRMSSTHIKDIKNRPEGILLNGKRVFVTETVKEGDVLSAEIGDLPNADAPEPIEMPLDILYEDEFFLLLVKPAGLLPHPVSFSNEPTLANGIAAYLKTNTPIHVVNRLDRHTDGICAVAKSAYVHRLLTQMLHTQHFVRDYIALCTAPPPENEGVIDMPIGREDGSVIKRRVRQDGQPSVTEYSVIARGDGLFAVRVRPMTGRTHQIRLHLASVGAPIAGDFLYGREDAGLIGRTALHSHSIRLTHPVTGEKIFKTAPLAEDMLSAAEGRGIERSTLL